MIMKINPSEYPKNRDWNDKVFSMPNIPRGSNGLILVLRDILKKVNDNFSPQQTLSFEGSNTKMTLDELCIRLRPMRFVIKTQNGWEITEESKKWLESEDNLHTHQEGTVARDRHEGRRVIPREKADNPPF